MENALWTRLKAITRRSSGDVTIAPESQLSSIIFVTSLLGLSNSQNTLHVLNLKSAICLPVRLSLYEYGHSKLTLSIWDLGEWRIRRDKGQI